MSWEVRTMQSKRSCFNATLYRKNLTRFWPLWGGVSLLGCVFPLYLLLMLLNSRGRYAIHAGDIETTLYMAVTIFAPAFLLLYTSICGVLVWSYLHNPRSVGLYHTLPVDRRCLFVTTLLSGLTMVFLPFVVVGGLTCLICLFAGILPATAVLWTILMVIGMGLFCFGAVTIAAMITGNSFAMLIFYYIGNFLAVLLDWLVSCFANGFYLGVTSYYTGAVEFLSPIVYLYRKFQVAYTYAADGETTIQILEGRWVVGIYALVGLALLAAGYVMYRRRKSECAGDVIAQGWLKPIFQYGLALCTGLTLGQLLYELVYRIPFQGGMYKHMIPMGICVAVMAILGYYVASMLLAKSLRVFRGDWQGPVTTIAIVVILCGCVGFDITGATNRIPDVDDIDKIEIYMETGSFTAEPDSAMGQQAMDLHRAILADADYVRAMNNNLSRYGKEYLDEDGMGVNILRTFFTIRYDLKNGEQIYRSYELPVVEDRWYNQPDTFDYKLHQLGTGSDTGMAVITPEYGGTLDGAYIDIWQSDSPYAVLGDTSISGQDAQRIYAAVQEDAQADRLLYFQIFSRDWEDKEEIGRIEFSFRGAETSADRERDGSSTHIEYCNVQIHSGMTSTLAVLADLAGAGNLEHGGPVDTVEAAA